jgi:predicted MFS family arabinose efflux permease
MGLDVVTLGRLVGLRSAMGIFAPVAGDLADRQGYRRVMQVALALGAMGNLLLALSGAVGVTAAGLVLLGLGMGAFVPTLQAYVSYKLPANQRARGMGMVEYSWALTGIFGLFFIGLLIQATSWRAPFFLLAAGMGVAALFVGAWPPVRGSAVVAQEQTHSRRDGQGWLSFFDLGANSRSIYACIAFGALTYFAAMQIMISHGAWLEREYGLSPAQLGTVALVFGFFDLAASVSVSLFTDRIGARRAVIGGAISALLAYLALPLLNLNLWLVVVGLGIARSCFEFTIVSYFPLLSEQSPDQRGKVMTISSAAALIGATIAGFTGPWMVVYVGVTPLVLTSAAVMVVALGFLLGFVRPR